MFKKILFFILLMLFSSSHITQALSVGQADFPDSYEEDIGEKKTAQNKTAWGRVGTVYGF